MRRRALAPCGDIIVVAAKAAKLTFLRMATHMLDTQMHVDKYICIYINVIIYKHQLQFLLGWEELG